MCPLQIYKRKNHMILNCTFQFQPVEEVLGTIVDKIRTDHIEKCPECGGRVTLVNRSDDKSKMTVYGHSGVRHVVHLEYRCLESHCRTGLYHGYRVLKGGNKIYEEDCLDPKRICLGLEIYV